jgi:alpha-amylase
MGVMLQAFYWDYLKAENQEHEWWTVIKSKLPGIAKAGFTALWLPPANKAAWWKSMGYDAYDYYDLGEFGQKGGVPTWFVSKAELLDLIQSAHALELQVYADLVFNHNSGADAQELNPIDGQSRWTKFTPKSGKFLRDWKCFHPSQYETWDGATFGEMPDLCHRTPLVYTELINYARWLLEEVGFDCSPTPSSSRTKVIPVSSGRITLTGTSPSRTIKAGSTRSSRFTSKMRAARLSCFS